MTVTLPALWIRLPFHPSSTGWHDALRAIRSTAAALPHPAGMLLRCPTNPSTKPSAAPSRSHRVSAITTECHSGCSAGGGSLKVPLWLWRPPANMLLQDHSCKICRSANVRHRAPESISCCSPQVRGGFQHSPPVRQGPAAQGHGGAGGCLRGAQPGELCLLRLLRLLSLLLWHYLLCLQACLPAACLESTHNSEGAGLLLPPH